jgi:peptidoglycan/LPS O-acetylase OafA/YrhL
VLSWSWLRSEKAQARFFLTLCALVLAWRCVLVFGLHAPQVRTFVGTDTRLDSILFGCALAVRGNPALDPPSFSRRLCLGVFLPLGLAVLGGCFALGDFIPFRESVRYSLQGLALAPVFISAVRYPNFWLFRPLNWKPLQHVGVLSYSLYLIHHVAIFALGARIPGWGAAATSVVGLFASLLLAEALYRLIERPVARLRKRFAADGGSRSVRSPGPQLG